MDIVTGVRRRAGGTTRPPPEAVPDVWLEDWVWLGVEQGWEYGAGQAAQGLSVSAGRRKRAESHAWTVVEVEPSETT